MAVEAFSAAVGSPQWCTGTLHDLLPDGTVVTGFSLCEAAQQRTASISGFQAKVSYLLGIKPPGSDIQLDIAISIIYCALSHTAKCK